MTGPRGRPRGLVASVGIPYTIGRVEKDSTDFFKHPIVATVVGGIILAIVLSVFPALRGWALTAIRWVIGCASAVWNWLVGAIAVPRGVLGFIAIAALGAIWIAWKRGYSRGAHGRSRTDKSNEDSGQAEAPITIRGTTLGPDEVSILKLLAAEDGGSISHERVRQSLNASRIRAEHTITVLQRLGLVDWYSDGVVGRGNGYLSASGRALCVVMKWVK